MESRRLRKVRVTGDELAALLDGRAMTYTAPESFPDLQVVHVTWEFETHSIMAYVTSDDFGEVPDGFAVPEWLRGSAWYGPGAVDLEPA